MRSHKRKLSDYDKQMRWTQGQPRQMDSKTRAAGERDFDCNTCNDFGFVRVKGMPKDDDVTPCPDCNPDGRVLG